MSKEAIKEPVKQDIPKAPPPQMIRAAVVPEALMQQMIDALRDHVPHKVADPLLKNVKVIQYGQFPVST